MNTPRDKARGWLVCYYITVINMVKIISIFGDKYKIRETFDAVDYTDGIVGYDVYDFEDELIIHYDCIRLSDLIKYLRWRIYRIYEL